MAASYQTGTASSPTNLLQTLVTWLVAQGWTQDSSAADGSGWRAHLHKGGLYVNLRAAMNETIWNYTNGGTAGYGIGLYLGDGYSGAANWRSQSGGPLASGTSNTVGAGMRLGSGAIVAYHFFDDGADHITVVVEASPGLFRHMGWGPTTVKTGFSADFPYFFGSSSSYYNLTSPAGQSQAGGELTALCPGSANVNTGDALAYGAAFVKVDAGTFSARWVGVNEAGGGTSAGYTGREARCSADQSGRTALAEYPHWTDYSGTRSWQTAYAGALLMPIHWFVFTSPGARWAPAGHLPSTFFCRGVGNGFAAGQVYAVGGVNYMVFPNFAVKKAA